MSRSRRPAAASAHLARSLLLAALVALAGLVPATAAPALAAAPDLTLTSETRYVVDPAGRAVHVMVALTATNRLADTKTRQYYFDRAYLAVQPGATNFAISARAGSPRVTVASAKADHTLLQIDFGRRLPAGSNRTFTLTFDLVDAGGAPTREIRIGESLVTFPAWAFATPETPGGSVTVVFPEGYAVEVESEQLGEPTTDATGNLVYTSGRLASPLAFFAYFVADRPTARSESIRTIEIAGRPVEVALRAWPDDPAWAERVGALVERGLPVLAERIGLPWLGRQPLVVAEAASRSSAGFAGRYDPAATEIEIAYYADSFVVLHEAAHAWFDGSLLAERWANEGFASWYALQAAAAIEEPAAPPVLTPEQLATRTPLNAWDAESGGEAAGGETTPDEVATDDVAYAASAELARLIAERAGPTGLASVWQAARDRVAAYQPAGLEAADRGGAMNGGDRALAAGEGSDGVVPERTAEPPDWRGLLDLLEERTGRRYDDLWRAWVVRPDEAELLVARATARRQYAEVVARAGEWRLPEVVRQAMRAWQFDQARELLTAADRALDDRDALAAAASAAGLRVPSTLEAAFEGNKGFAAAAVEADAQLTTIAALQEARRARPAEQDLFVEVGLWGASPDADAERAARAFEAGDLDASVEASFAAFSAWAGAADTGRSRIAAILGAFVAAIIGVWLVFGMIRGLWRRGSSRAARIRARTRRLQAHRLDGRGGSGSAT
ncbi:MAG TPA: hypothetical protein VFT20_12775 [Candidatus Limnocylindrales bacterium]|nr:hypothetical protein [Candidatus Limnocylindrales bacterium]